MKKNFSQKIRASFCLSFLGMAFSVHSFPMRRGEGFDQRPTITGEEERRRNDSFTSARSEENFGEELTSISENNQPIQNTVDTQIVPVSLNQQIIKGMQYLTQRSELEEDCTYGLLQDLWKERSAIWDQYHSLCQQGIASNEALEQMTQSFEEAIEAATEENLAKTRLGCFSQGAKCVGQGAVMAGAIVPPLVLVGDWLSKMGQVAGEANKLLAQRRIQEKGFKQDFARREVDSVDGKIIQNRDIILDAEEALEQIENKILLYEQNKNELLAEALVPQTGWSEDRWKQWAKIIFEASGKKDPSEENVRALVFEGRTHQELVLEQCCTIWRNRLEKNQKALSKLKSRIKEELSPSEKKANEFLKKIRKAQDDWPLFFQEQEKLNQEKEQLEEKIQQYEKESKNPEAGKMEHLDYLRSLKINAKQLHLFSSIKQKAEEKINLWKVELRKIETTELQNKYRQSLILLERLLERRFTSDQQELRKNWPKQEVTFRPYDQWKLLCPKELVVGRAKEHEDLSENSVLIEPLPLKSEIEARGRLYFHQTERAIEKALQEDEIESLQRSSQLNVSVSLANIVEPLTNQEKFALPDLKEDPKKELLDWSLDQVKSPSEQEKKRWTIRKELELAIKKSRSIALARRQCQGKEPPNSGLETSVGSVLYDQQKERHRFGSISSTSEISSLSSVFGFRFETRLEELNKKTVEVNKLILTLNDEWKKEMEEAEIFRKVRVKKEFVTPDEMESAWEEADQQALLLWNPQEMNREVQEDWDARIERWRFLKQANKLETELKPLRDTNDALKVQKFRDDSSIEEENDLEKQKEKALQDWKKKLLDDKNFKKELNKALQQYNQEEKKDVIQDQLEKKFKGKDQAVLERWTQFVDRMTKEQDVDRQIAEDNAANYSINLKLDFNQKVQKVFGKEEIAQLKEEIRKRALNDAKQNTPGAEDAWKEGGQESALYQKEKKRLDGIEQFWETIFHAKERVNWNKRHLAAQEYMRDNKQAWYDLNKEEQQRYNEEVQKINRFDDDKLEEEEKLHLDFASSIKEQKEKLEELVKAIHELNQEIQENEPATRALFAWEKKDSQKKRLKDLKEKENEQRVRTQALQQDEVKYQENTIILEALRKNKTLREKDHEWGNKSPEELEEFVRQKICEAKKERDEKKIENIREKIRALQQDFQKTKEEKNENAAKQLQEAIEILEGDGVNGCREGVIWAYQKAWEADNDCKDEIARLYRKVVNLRVQQVEAIQQKIGKTLNLPLCKKIDDAIHQIGKTAEQMSKAQIDNQQEIVEAYRNTLRMREKQIENLVRGNEQAAERLRKVLEILEGDGVDNHKNTVIWAYNQAWKWEVDHQGENNIGEAYRKVAKAYEKQATALLEDNKDAIELFENLALVTLGTIGANLRKFPSQENFMRAREVEDSYRGLIWIYEKILKAKVERNQNLIDSYQKAADFREREVECLFKENREDAELNKKIADAFSAGALSLEDAANPKHQENAKLLQQFAKAYDALAQSLLEHEEDNVGLYRKAIDLLGVATGLIPGGSYYTSVSDARYEARQARNGRGKEEIARVYDKVADIIEKEAEALIGKDVLKAQLCEQAIDKLVGNFRLKKRNNISELDALVLGGRNNAYKVHEDMDRGQREGTPSTAIWAYTKAAEADSNKENNVARVFRKLAKVYERQAEALINGDKTKSDLFQQIAKILDSSCESNNDFFSNDYNRNMLKSIGLFEGKVEQHNTSNSFGAIWAYQQAEINKENSYIANAYNSCGEAYEQQADALTQKEEAVKRNDQVEVILQIRMAEILGEIYHGAASKYSEAADAEKKGKHEEAEHYLKQGEAREKEAKALKDYLEAVAQGDEEAKKIYELIRGVAVVEGKNKNQEALDNYIKAAKEVAQGNKKLAELYVQAGKTYEAETKALDQKEEALKRGDLAETSLQENIAITLREKWRLKNGYSEAADAEKQGKHEEAERYLKQGEAREKEAKALKDYLEAVAQGDEEAKKIHELIRGVAVVERKNKNQKALDNYIKAAKEVAQGNKKLAELYVQAGKTYEAGTKALDQKEEALKRGDLAEAFLQKEIAITLREECRGAGAYYYSEAADAEKKGKYEEAERYLKEGEAREKEAKALQDYLEAVAQGDEEAKKIHELIKGVAVVEGRNENWQALDCYIKAAQALAQKNYRALELYTSAGKAYQSSSRLISTDFLRKNSEKELEGKIAYAFYRAAENKDEISAIYQQAAKMYEQQLTAIKQRDEKAIQYGQAATILESSNYDSSDSCYNSDEGPGLIAAYYEAEKAEVSNRSEINFICRDLIKVSKKRVEALLKENKKEAADIYYDFSLFQRDLLTGCNDFFENLEQEYIKNLEEKISSLMQQMKQHSEIFLNSFEQEGMTVAVKKAQRIWKQKGEELLSQLYQEKEIQNKFQHAALARSKAIDFEQTSIHQNNFDHLADLWHSAGKEAAKVVSKWWKKEEREVVASWYERAAYAWTGKIKANNLKSNEEREKETEYQEWIAELAVNAGKMMKMVMRTSDGGDNLEKGITFSQRALESAESMKMAQEEENSRVREGKTSLPLTENFVFHSEIAIAVEAWYQARGEYWKLCEQGSNAVEEAQERMFNLANQLVEKMDSVLSSRERKILLPPKESSVLHTEMAAAWYEMGECYNKLDWDFDFDAGKQERKLNLVEKTGQIFERGVVTVQEIALMREWLRELLHGN